MITPAKSGEYSQAHLQSAIRDRSYLWLCGAVSLFAVGFLVYALNWAFTWDESYHLVAAQLVNTGKTPYIDYCFPQSPLNLYWNAAWMRLLGETWRVPHAFSALFATAAVLLMADYVFVRFPDRNWRLVGAIAAALMIGLNAMVFIYAPLAQPYGICMFGLAAAFRFSVRAVERDGPRLAAAAGLLAGVAAASSLLTLAALPVLAIWMLAQNRAGGKWTKLAAYCAGAVIPFTPVYRLFWLGPRQTWFNLFQYHLFYRKLYWPETTEHDLEILTSWVDSGQALVTGLLAVFGLIYLMRKTEWPRSLKNELYLCVWLAAALSAEVGSAHPTFSRYFLLAVPFLAVVAVVGLYAVSSRLHDDDLVGRTPRSARDALVPLSELDPAGLQGSDEFKSSMHGRKSPFAGARGGDKAEPGGSAQTCPEGTRSAPLSPNLVPSRAQRAPREGAVTGPSFSKGSQRPWVLVSLVAIMFALGLGRSLYDHHNAQGTWSSYESRAKLVDQVTPRGAPLYADEPIYFLTHRIPPPGFELYYTHKLELPPAQAALLHILSSAEVKRQVQSGMFATAYTCDLEDEIANYGLNALYQHQKEVGDCTVFWDLKK